MTSISHKADGTHADGNKQIIVGLEGYRSPMREIEHERLAGCGLIEMRSQC